jgi:hypothetical protein
MRLVMATGDGYVPQPHGLSTGLRSGLPEEGSSE